MNTMNAFAAAAALLFAAPAIADDHGVAAGEPIHHAVSASDVSGATLWDFKGNKLGELEEVYLMAGTSESVVVLDTSILDDNRKVVIPFNIIVVKTESDDADEIIYTLNADKDKLMGAPEYKGDKKMMKDDLMGSCKYWDKDYLKKAKGNMKDAGEHVKDAADKAGDALEEAADGIKKSVKE